MTLAVVLTFSRTSLALSPLVLSGTRDDPSSTSVLGVTGYTEPPVQPRIKYAPTSDWVNGDVALSRTLQQSLITFRVRPVDATETDARTALNELQSAISQLSFTVTEAISGAPARIWSCDPGSMQLANPRSYADLKTVTPVWAVSIPCYPLPS